MTEKVSREGSHSGLVRRTRNAVGEKSPQRFKSSTLRSMVRLKHILIATAIVVSISVLIYLAVFGRALSQEEDHINIAISLPKVILTSRVAQISDGKYLSSNIDSFIEEMKGQGFSHIDQMGSAYIFTNNGKEYISSGRMYSSYFMIFTYPEESRS